MAFEWNPSANGGTCFLKDSSGVVPRPFEGARSGVLVMPGDAISTAAVHSNNIAASAAGSSSISAVGSVPATAFTTPGE